MEVLTQHQLQLAERTAEDVSVSICQLVSLTKSSGRVHGGPRK